MTEHEQQVMFAKLLPKLIEQAFALGFEVTMGECWRTPEQAAWNAAHGFGIAKSLHTERMAVDLLLFKDGVLLTASSDYQPLADWWKEQNPLACWGGDFKNSAGLPRPDVYHFSLTWNGIK
jgi:hypothetical protein